MKSIAILIFLVLSQSCFSQRELKKEWFFGAEIGNNNIASFNLNERKNSIQAGLMAEYFFANKWSLSGRIKYFKTGLSYSSSSSFGQFDGAVISIPLNIKYHYNIDKNLTANLKLGFALNQEVKSEYNYFPDTSTNYSKFYGTFNPGMGVNCFISSRTAIYLDLEAYVLGNDRDQNDWFDIVPNAPNNVLLNFGIKFKLTPNKKKILGIRWF